MMTVITTTRRQAIKIEVEGHEDTHSRRGAASFLIYDGMAEPIVTNSSHTSGSHDQIMSAQAYARGHKPRLGIHEIPVEIEAREDGANHYRVICYLPGTGMQVGYACTMRCPAGISRRGYPTRTSGDAPKIEQSGNCV